MRTIACFAATAILLSAPVEVALAQNAPDPGASAPATTAAPAPPVAQTPPADAPAPAAQTANPPAPNPPASDTSATPAKPSEKAAVNSAPKAKKKKPIGMTRRREIEKSIDSGTVPSRYRSSVPKEYQRYIPFSKD